MTRAAIRIFERAWGPAGPIAVAVGLATAPSVAQELPEVPGPERAVKLFDLFCLDLVPDIARIGEIADRHFDEITGEELDRFRPSPGDGNVRAWRFDDFGGDYVLTTSSTPPGDSFRAEVPELAGATGHSCSILLPPAQAQDGISSELVALLARPADRTWENGQLRASLWVREAGTMVSNVLHYRPADGAPGGLLSTVVFVQPSGPEGPEDD